MNTKLFPGPISYINIDQLQDIHTGIEEIITSDCQPFSVVEDRFLSFDGKREA